MHQTTKQISSSRNYGIDLLRLVAALYVVILHTLGIGGIYEATAPYSYQNDLCRLLLTFTSSAVNIFGIISGYVGYRGSEKKISYSGYLPVWLTVVFYCVLYVAAFALLRPGSITGSDLTVAFFPVTTRFYWYFSAYTLVYLLAPFLNKILHCFSDKELKKLFCVICFILVPIEYIGTPFVMNSGYSPIWLLLLYLVGGILKKTGIGSKIPAWLLVVIIAVVNIALFYLGAENGSWRFFIFDIQFRYDYSYITPFYLVCAICHVLLFSRFRFPAGINKAIGFAAPAAFSIYIANTNKTLWNNFIWTDPVQSYLASWAASSPVGLAGKVLICALAFMLAVILIDFFRRQLFRILGVHKWAQTVSDFPQKFHTR